MARARPEHGRTERVAALRSARNTSARRSCSAGHCVAARCAGGVQMHCLVSCNYNVVSALAAGHDSNFNKLTNYDIILISLQKKCNAKRTQTFGTCSGITMPALTTCPCPRPSSTNSNMGMRAAGTNCVIMTSVVIIILQCQTRGLYTIVYIVNPLRGSGNRGPPEVFLNFIGDLFLKR